MKRFLAEKDYNSESNKIDLTLKLSPCGEDPEERKMKRSSSMVGNGTQWGPFVPSLDRSSSLPSETEKGLVMFGALQALGRAESGKGMMQWMVTNHVEGASYTRHLSTRVLNNFMVNSSKAMMENGITPPPRPSSHTKNKAAIATDIPHDRFKLGNYCTLEGDVMENLNKMPIVTTTGDGPNGKRIEGILYKYMDGVVCIVCVCHGNFFTPEEFIVHAGGKGVENPMKHITVHTTSF